MNRLRVITNAFTRLRICTDHGEMDFKFKGELTDIPKGYQPWFDIAGRESKEGNHHLWSLVSTGVATARQAVCAGYRVALWGGQLTALRLEDRAIFQVPCSLEDAPQSITLD